MNDTSNIVKKEQKFIKWTPEKIKEYNKANHFGNNSFSGADMVAIMHITGVNGVKGVYTLGSLQTLSYSTSMQRMPIRSVGNVNAKDYVMGPRTIAGSLVFAVFDKHFAYEAMKAIKGITEEDYHFLADELPPFDITITFANEYGKIAKLAIYGIRLINEGQVMSINDIFTENTYQYVATDIDYLSDQTTNTSGNIYTPLKPNPNSTSKPIDIEDVVIDEPTEPSEDIAKYQVVYVKPTDAYNENGVMIKGKASMDLFKRVEYGSIQLSKIDSEEVKTFELSTGVQFPIIDSELEPGDYMVRYYSGKSFSRPSTFSINYKSSGKPSPDMPVLVVEEQEADKTFTIGIQATDVYTEGIQYTDNIDDSTSWKIINPPATYSVIKGLKEYTFYYFRAYNEDGVSEVLTCYTDAKRDKLFSDFETYIYANKYYLEKEWPYVDKILNAAHKQWLSANVDSVSKALEKSKKDLNSLDKEEMAAYQRLCDIAVRYEKNQAYYVSQDLIVKAPKIIDEARTIVEMEKNVTGLKITNVGTGFSETISSSLFKTENGKYRYTINSKFVGVHQLIALGENGKHSNKLYVSFPDRAYLEKMLAQSSIDLILERKDFTNALMSASSQEVLSKGKDDSLLLKELSNSNKVQKCGIGSPEIIYSTDVEVNIKCSVPIVYNNSLYLCLSPTDQLGITQLKTRKPLLGPSYQQVLYKSKDSLITGKRYSLWVETHDGVIVSTTTGFEFNSSDVSSTQELINAEMIGKAKTSYEYQYNKNLVDNYKEQENLSENIIYRNIIGDAMINVGNNDINKMNYIHDAIKANHKTSHSSINNNTIADLKINFNTMQVTGKIKEYGWTKLVVCEYKKEDYHIWSATKITDNSFSVEDLNNTNDYVYMYFTNDTVTSVSSICLFDLKNKVYKGTMKAEVTWL